MPDLIIYPDGMKLNPPPELMDKNTRRDRVLRDIVENPDYGSPAIAAIPGNSSYYELGILHPSLANWLTKSGYTYEHHYAIPNIGIVDFLARRNDEILVIDAKESPKNLSRSLTQISDYRYHIDKQAVAAIALPAYTLTDKCQIMCKKRKIDIIALDIEEKTDGIRAQPARPPMPSALWLDWYLIYGGDKTSASEWTDVDWHELKRFKSMLYSLLTR
jgi:hypothetical protein